MSNSAGATFSTSPAAIRGYCIAIASGISSFNARPATIHWRKLDYPVTKVLDYWILQSKWWIREEKWVYFEVLCRDGAVMTVFKRDGEWVLAKVLD